MKNLLLLSCLAVLSLKGYSQTKKNRLVTGFEFAVPSGKPFISNKAKSYTLNIKAEHFFVSFFSGSVSAGYSFYKGPLLFWDSTSADRFRLIPLMAGCRYYIKKYYLGLEAGKAISIDKTAETNFVVSPSAGVVLRKFEAGINFFSVLSKMGIPEKNFLENGGYSYVGLRIAYRLNSKNSGSSYGR